MVHAMHLGAGVSTLAFNTHHNVLVVGLNDGFIVIYDLQSYRSLYKYKAHGQDITSIKVYDNKFTLWLTNLLSRNKEY